MPHHVSIKVNIKEKVPKNGWQRNLPDSLKEKWV